MQVELTEELKEKALAVGDDNVLTKVAVGDVVANELKYHSSCLIGFRRRFDDSEANSEDTLNAPDTRSLEEVLSQIDEDLSEGRTCFPLMEIHQELTRRDKQYGYERECNRTRLKLAILQRFPILKEESGSRSEVMLVTKESMKNVVSSCLAFSSKSSDSCTLAKSALICRREMKRFWAEENNTFLVEEHGFRERCQQDSIPHALKFMIGKRNL